MDDELIKKEITNHLTLGQWELAKSLIFAYWNNSHDENGAQEWISQVLINICSSPEKYCVGSLSLPSIYHLSWYALELIEELKIEKPEVEYLKKRAEFKLYVYKASKICNDTPYKDLASVFEEQHFRSNESNPFEDEATVLSSNIENFLFDLKSKNPLLASYILRALLNESQFNTITEHLSFNWIRCKCQEIKANVLKYGVEDSSTTLGEQILSELRVYVFILSESNLTPQLPEDIICDLLSLTDENIISKKNVYEALLGNSESADSFCEVEDRLLGRNEAEKNIESAECFFRMIFLSDGTINTKELFLRSMRRKEHFLEIILNNLLILVKSNKHAQVQNYLNHRLTTCLRPLLVLLSWDVIQTNKDAKNVLDCLWPDSLDKKYFEPTFVKACNKLVRNVNFAQWCLEQREKNPEVATSEESSFTNLCLSLKTHSAVYVLKQYLQLSKLNINAVEDILLTFMSPKNVTKEKSVRFASEAINDDWEDKVQKSVDCKILQSYCIMSAAMEAVQFSAEFEAWSRNKKVRKNRLTESVTSDYEKWTSMYRERVINNLEEVEQLLPSLYPLIHRLEILENLFTLIFATHEDVKTDVSTDSGQSSEYDDCNGDIAYSEDDDDMTCKDNEKKVKKITRSLSDGMSVLSNCSGNSSASYNCNRHGFLCNDTVIRSILRSIKDNLLDISLKFEKRNSVSNLVFWTEDGNDCEVRERKFLQRIAELKKYVSEAIWRFEIITVNENDKNNSIPLAPCPVYLKIEGGKQSETRENVRSNSLVKTLENSLSSTFPLNKPRKRKRARLTSTRFHGCFNTNCCHETINKMLSSKESLLNMCLQQMDSVKGQQVIKVFAMEETDAAAEIIFFQKYNQLAKQFETTKAYAMPLIPASFSTPSLLSASLSHIASTAAAGMTATTDVTIVDDFLSRCVLPTTIKIEECMNNSSNPFCQELAECTDLKALVLCDLAFTSSQSLDTSASLLHAAIKRLNSIDVKGQFQARNAGLHNFATRMISLTSEVTSKQNGQLSLFTEAVFPVQTNLCNLLLQGSISLKAENYSNDIDNWNNLLGNLTTFYDLKEKYMDQDSRTGTIDNQLATDLHNAFIKLVRDSSLQLRQNLTCDDTSMECQYPNYLKTICVYMRKLATLGAHQNPEHKDSTSRCNFLTVLDKGLTSTLIDMVKEKDANIEWIEKFTIQFELDFKHLITQARVGTISATGYSLTEYGDVVFSKYGQFVLNCKLHSQEKSNLNPNNVVSDILINIIYLIKENFVIEDGILTFDQLQEHKAKIQRLLDDTNKLSLVDLSLLKTCDECYAFLINVTNLLSFHATLLRVANENNVRFRRSRLLNESCQVAYYIGQFGVISLFELQCLLGYTPDLKIPESVLELRKGGFMESLIVSNPRVSFLISRFFLTSPLLKVVSANSLNSDLIFAITEYFKAHVEIKYSEKEITVPEYLIDCLIADSDNKSLLSLVKTHCAFDPSENAESDFQIVTRPTNYLPAIILSYPKKGFECFAVEPVQEKSIINVIEIPAHIRDHLKEKCWLVDYLIDVLGGEISNDERVEFLNRLLNEFKCIPSTEVLVPAIHEINFWIDLEDKLMNDKDWESLLKFIDVSSTMRLEIKKFMTPLRDFILCHLLNNDINEYLPQRIKNVHLRAYCVLSMYRRWDFNNCLNSLLHVATDRDLSDDLRDKLIALYKRISIYGQVIKVVPSTDLWQEIEDKSLNNPDEILTVLTLQQNYSLAIEWAELHSLSVEQSKMVQHVNLMLLLDKDEPDLIEAIIFLEKITDPHSAVEICEEALISLDNLSSQVFIIEYLVNNLADYLTEARKEELHLTHMGIKIMFCLPQSDSKYFAPISSSPALVLEQLIMNTKIELLGKALDVIKTDVLALNPNIPASAESIKCLLKTYAKKSLEIQIIQPRLSPDTAFEQIMHFRTKRSDSAFVIPLYPPKKEDWVPDEFHSVCMVCREETFNMFNRRHHCRRCGRVVCANCSRYRIYVQGYEDVKVRVCSDCKEYDSGASQSFSSAFNTSVEKKLSQHTNFDGSPASSVGSSIHIPKYTDEPYPWLLTLAEDHNKTVRGEFNFEQTPNVSLCISLLDCFLREEEAAAWVLELCEMLFVVLQPDKDTGLPNPEVNHNVIVSVIESLIMSAKVKFANLSNHAGMGKCDLCSQNLYLVKLLITSNCYHLVPGQGLNSHEDIRRLRNQLVNEERWNLALEVTTKNRLDASGVWVSWGLALLKACDFVSAREKFAHCLEKTTKKNYYSSTSFDILTEIIKQLELNLYKKDDEMITVKNCLASLREISKLGGQAYLLPKRTGANMNDKIFEECLFYLKTYGSSATLISFYIKHRQIEMTLKLIREKEFDSALFINSLFMPCLHAKLISQLEKELLKIDCTLNCWQRYLVAVCKHLKRMKFYNTLHQLQLFCKDYIRAASTCVKLFSDNATDYVILFDRLHILDTACSHLHTALQEKQTVPLSIPQQPKWKGYHVNSQSNLRSSLRQDLPVNEILKLLDIIQYQIEITKYFKENQVDTVQLIKEFRENPSNASKRSGVPVVFDNSTELADLSAVLFLANVNVQRGFEMASTCIDKCHLEYSLAFSLIGRILVQKQRYEDTRQLITFMKNKNVSSEKIDEVIWSCLLILVQKPYDVIEVDKFIQLLTSRQHKINAFKLCGRLNHGYLTAIAANDVNAVLEIAKAAEEANNKRVLDVCNSWLQSRMK